MLGFFGFLDFDFGSAQDDGQSSACRWLPGGRWVGSFWIGLASQGLDPTAFGEDDQ
jgi:hypothetical protein